MAGTHSKREAPHMYLKFYGLKKEPFHITPDPEFIYLSPSHKEALSLMVQGVGLRSGLIVLTGGIGAGKTTLVRSFSDHCRQKQIKMISVLNPRVTFGALLSMIYRELGLEVSSEDVAERVQGFRQFLIEAQNQDRNVVLVIDEAQNMSINTLKDLQMLSNLETSQGKLLQILLVGQTELETKLNLKEQRQLQQSIGIRIRIAELTEDECLSYIQYRLTVAGMQIKETSTFTRAALRLIVKQSLGVPIKINVICDNALRSGFASGMNPVPVSIVKEVIACIDGKRARMPAKRVVAYASLALMFLVITVLAIVRVMNSPGKPGGKGSPGFITSGQGSVENPVGTASPVDTPVPKSAPGAAAVPGFRSPPTQPAVESPKFQGVAAAGRDVPVVAPGTKLPMDQGATKSLPAERASDLHGSVSIIQSVSQLASGEPSGGKPDLNIEAVGGKTDISAKEPNASPTALTKTASGQTVESKEHGAVQKAVKPVREGEPSSLSGSTVSKPGAVPAEDAPDPNKLMDWFLNKRGR